MVLKLFFKKVRETKDEVAKFYTNLINPQMMLSNLD